MTMKHRHVLWKVVSLVVEEVVSLFSEAKRYALINIF